MLIWRLMTDLVLNGETLELAPATLTDAQKARIPALANWPAYQVNLSSEQAKTLVKNQLAIAAYDASNKLLTASYVQAAKVLDDLYTSGEQDANEATLGVQYLNGTILKPRSGHRLRARSNSKVYNSSKTLTATQPMTLDAATGIWSYSAATATLDKQFYRFELTGLPSTKQKT